MFLVEVSMLGVIIAAIAYVAIGAIWYSPAVMGNQWMRLMNLKKKDMGRMREGMGRSFLGAVIVALVMSYVMAVLLAWVDASNLTDALTVSMWVWIGFVATTGISSVLWENKPFDLYVINASCFLVSMLAMSAILISV